MQQKNYSLIFRIMHWLMAFCLLSILLTIFLRFNWLNRGNIEGIIQNHLTVTNQSLPESDITAIARQIRKPMWDWHIYIGYVLVGLFSLRILLAFLNKMKFESPFVKSLSGKEKFQYSIYLIFFICLAASLVTGLFIEFGPETFKDFMEETHKLSIYYLIAFILLHFGGVLLAEFTNKKGIISNVISGTEKQ